MRTWLRRHGLTIVLSLAVLGVAILLLFASRFDREPPNYSEVEDGLWLGGFVDRPPRGTGAVLNLCESPDPYLVESHRWRAIPDAEPAPSLDWLHEQVEFIKAERAAGRIVYVHCRNGVSRSAFVTIAYLMRREGWTRDETLRFLRTRRSIVRPHPAFAARLLEWEKRINER